MKRLLTTLDELVISVDGVSLAVLRSKRPGLDVARFWENLAMVAREKRRHGLPVLISYNVVVDRENRGEVSAIIAKAAENEVPLVRVVNTAYLTHATDGEAGRQYKSDIRSRALGLEEQDVLKSEIEDACARYGIELRYADTRPAAPRCWWPHGGVYVTFDGFVTPCCQRMDPRVLHFGNVLREPFAAIWARHGEFRARFTQGSYPSVCANCPTG